MKTNCFFLLLSCFFSLDLPAQADSLARDGADSPFDMFDAILDRPPSFPGGETGLLQFLASSIQYPELARANNIQGTVAATFVVNKDGSVSDAFIIKDIGGGCGLEVLRVLSFMPAWIPGEADGQPVKVRFTLPVRFRLEGDTKKKKRN